jgi:1-acyl-sn-glycerol-3-phosphate acyltransferase
LRILRHRRRERLREIEVEGLDHLRAAVAQDCGVLIASNHGGHADAFIMLAAADQLGRPFTYMVAWQSLLLLGPVGRWILRRHGCFSVDREGHDVRAFRQAVDLVQSGSHPLVIFAEGEVYHNNDKVYPFRPGAAAIALAAARRAHRPVVCVPAAIRYSYLADPTPHLVPLLDRLERRLGVRAQPH